MGRYICSRILSAILVVWFVATLTFIIMHAIPGGPFSSEKALPPAIIENINQRYHLKDPIFIQYFDYIRNVAHFEFGPSFRFQGRSVNEIFREGLPHTAALGLFTTVFSLFCGIGLGVVAALKQNKALDYFTIFLATMGVCIPNFVLATIFQYYFGYKIHWFAPIGWGGLNTMVLPVLALSAYPIAQITRLVRSGVLEVLQQDYIKTARAKGLPDHVIVFRHVLKNAVIPLLSYLGPFFAYVLTGSFVIETIFNIPGIGQFFVNSVSNRDYPMIMGITILYSTFLVVFNLLVDLAYTFIDPRIKLARIRGEAR